MSGSVRGAGPTFPRNDELEVGEVPLSLSRGADARDPWPAETPRDVVAVAVLMRRTGREIGRKKGACRVEGTGTTLRSGMSL